MSNKIEDHRKYVKMLNEMWNIIFSLADKVDMKKPLTTKILSNPNHEFVKLMLYIYSMQTFIFKEMNRASRNKDQTKIPYYGPFASALGYIIHSASSKRKDG